MANKLHSKIKSAVLIIFFMLEILLVALVVRLWCVSIALPEEGDPPALAFIIFLAWGISFLCVTVISFVRLKKNKNRVLIYNFILKFILTWIAFGLLGIPTGVPEITILFLITGAIPILVFFIAKHTRSKQYEHIHRQLESISVLPIEAERSMNSAVAEYCKIYNKSIYELTDDERVKIYEYASGDMLYFLAWLVKNDFLSEQINEENIVDIKSEKISPIEILYYTDYAIIEDMLSEEIVPFVDSYYNSAAVRCYSIYNFGRYLNHYYEAIRNDKNLFYCLDFSWDTYHILEKKIDESYKYFLRENELCEYLYDIKKWDLLNVHLAVITADGVSKDYIKCCLNFINNLSEGTIDTLCDMLIDFLEVDNYPEFMFNRRKILEHILPDTLTIYTPHRSEPAFVIGCESDFEPEHGIAWSMRGDKIIFMGYRADVESDNVWGRKSEFKYKLLKIAEELDIANIDTKEKIEKAVEHGGLKVVQLIPKKFGGEECESNIVYLPTLAAEYKKKVDMALEGMTASGISVESYSCEPRYKGKSLIPCEIVIWASLANERTHEYIDIW